MNHSEFAHSGKNKKKIAWLSSSFLTRRKWGCLYYCTRFIKWHVHFLVVVILMEFSSPSWNFCSSRPVWGRRDRTAKEARLYAVREWELAYFSRWSERWGWSGGLAPGRFSMGQWPVVPPEPRWALQKPPHLHIYLRGILFDICVNSVFWYVPHLTKMCTVFQPVSSYWLL